MKKEILILSKINHPNIVAFLGANTVEGFMIMEWMRGSLGDLMYNKESTAADNRTSEFEWGASGRKVMTDAAMGLAHFHELRIILFDLKPQNLLVSHDLVGKIADVRALTVALRSKPSLSHACVPTCRSKQGAEEPRLPGRRDRRLRVAGAPATARRRWRATSTHSAWCCGR